MGHWDRCRRVPCLRRERRHRRSAPNPLSDARDAGRARHGLDAHDGEDAIHERIADSRLVVMPRYRHSLLIETTAEVVSELRAFLNGRARELPAKWKWSVSRGTATCGRSRWAARLIP